MKDFSSNEPRAARAAHVAFSLHPVWAPVALTLAALGLVAAYFLTVKAPSFWGPEVARMFDLTEEANVPTWFGSSLWLVAALLAFAVFRVHRDRGYPNAAYWMGMVPLFVFLSIDEAGKVHETIGDVLGRRLEGYSILDYTFAWIFFGLALLLSVGVVYLRFLLRLEKRTRVLFFISAGLYVTGAVVIESIGAAVWNGAIEAFPLGQTWPRMIVYEELLEMVGVILLIHTLLRVLALDEAPYATPA
jgi:hypothetical protein